MNGIILTTDEKLKELLYDVLAEHEQSKAKTAPTKLYTINKVAKMTKTAHATIKKKIMAGLIKTTADGLITEEALNEYLKNQ